MVIWGNVRVTGKKLLTLADASSKLGSNYTHHSRIVQHNVFTSVCAQKASSCFFHNNPYRIDHKLSLSLQSNYSSPIV